jgi:putative CocE/NonD family hydrolase
MRTVHDFPRAVRVVENVFIPMADGARLAARLWLPEDAQENPVPAIFEYLPYRKRDMTRYRDDPNHSYLAGHGYAVIRVDMRGSGDSDDVLRDEYLQQELDDGVEVLRWLGEQPWCTGRVGMMGISWGGFNGLQIAAMQPPELGAIVTACSTDDRYADDIHYMGGCLLGDNLSWASTMFAYNSCPPDPELVGQRWREMWMERLEDSGLWIHNWLKHQRRDEFWKHGSICEDFSAVKTPVLAVSGWADGYSNAVFRLLANLDCPRRGLIGPWSHKYPHMGEPGPAIGFLQEVVRWFDAWLKDEENGVLDDPMLRCWMQDSVPPSTGYSQRPGRWVAERTWPTPNIEEQRFPLDRARLGQPEERPDHLALSVLSPLSVGLFAGKWCSYAAGPDLPHDQREEDGGALVFESDPLLEPIEILGSPVLDLEFSVDKPTAMVAVRLSDVAPDGKATRVTYGLLNLTHRNGHEDPQPLEPDRTYRVAIELNDVAQVFPRSHALRVSVSTSYFPLAWLPPEPARLTVHTGTSELRLPVRPPREEDATLREFGPPEAGPPMPKTILRAPHANWRVIRDLANDVSTLEVLRFDGDYRIQETGMRVERITKEWYTFTGDDPTTARGETWTKRRFRRGSFDVSIEGRTVLTCSATEFFIHAQMDAFEGERRVFAKNWDYAVPRDLV